jgi:hypothetical protein
LKKKPPTAFGVRFIHCKGKKCKFHCNGELLGCLERKVEVVKKNQLNPF